jgi:ankyrin repeat protein
MKKENFLVVFVITILFIISGCAAKSPLIQASSKGDVSTVRQLINEGANVNETDSRGYTPLMYAVWSENVETIQILLNKGVNVNAKDSAGMTPLAHAVYHNSDIDIIKLLIKGGANVNVQTNDGQTLTDIAVSNFRGDILDELIIAGAKVWVTKEGKARLIFYGSEMEDYCTVYIGKDNKTLSVAEDNGRISGIVFFDVEPGKHDVTIKRSSASLFKSKLSIDAKEGQIYYVKILLKKPLKKTEYPSDVAFDVVTLIGGYAAGALYKDSVADYKVNPLKVEMARQEIKNIIKSKELK